MLYNAYTLIADRLIPLLLAGAGVGLLITIHEFGHFVFARLFNVGVPVFSIGFGPGLIKRTIGSTEFRLSLIPLGGYCAIQGMSDPEAGMVDTSGMPEDPAQDFENKALWQKILIMLGGILFNILFACIVFISQHTGHQPKTDVAIIIESVDEESAAAKAGLAAGTRIRGYNESTFSPARGLIQEQAGELLQTIARSANKPLELLVVEPGKGERSVIVVAEEKSPGFGFLGISLSVKSTEIPGEYENISLSDGIKRGLAITSFYIKQAFNIIPAGIRRRSLDGLGGPLSLFHQAFKSAASGLRALLSFMASFSITLAVLNLIPLGALDGGQLLFVLIEGIIRRKLPQRLKESVIIASWLFFMGLVVVLSYKDIMRLVASFK